MTTATRKCHSYIQRQQGAIKYYYPTYCSARLTSDSAVSSATAKINVLARYYAQTLFSKVHALHHWPTNAALLSTLYKKAQSTT